MLYTAVKVLAMSLDQFKMGGAFADKARKEANESRLHNSAKIT
jgi:hypothetical protein